MSSTRLCMECKNCGQNQRQFYCQSCLRSHLRDFRLQTHHFATDRDEQVSKASGALGSVADARVIRASVRQWEGSLAELQSGLKCLRNENDARRHRLNNLRENLDSRRKTLASAKRLPPSPQDRSLSKEIQELTMLSTTLARARLGLVQELVEVFNVVEVGGRPQLGGRPGTKGEWMIGELVLPVPGDIRRYPPQHINAVLTYTIHFLGLLTFYLGVKLPFEITWTGKKLGVGQPWICAGSGTDSGSWARWSTKHPLHLSAAATPREPDSPSIPPDPPSLSDSYIPAPPLQSSFTTALAMLLYNVCYIAHTQCVDVPLSQAGDILSNLWAVCCSAELGRRSHATHPLLPPPTPPSFTLDFSHLLQATTANPASRRVGSKKPSASTTSRWKSGREQDTIVEEGGWDLVEDMS